MQEAHRWPWHNTGLPLWRHRRRTRLALDTVCADPAAAIAIAHYKLRGGTQPGRAETGYESAATKHSQNCCGMPP